MKVRLAAAIAATLLAVPAPVQAAPGGTSISVGGPAEPVVMRTGGSVTTSIRITNGTNTAERVALQLATLTPEDDGRLSVVDRADPAWSGRVDLPAQVTVPADGGIEVPVTVTAPASLPADYYLIGVLAEPVVTTPREGVQVNARVAAVLNMDVPGVREREVSAAFGSLPRFRFASELTGTVDVSNVGDAGAMTRTQVRIDDRDGRNLAVLPVSGEDLQLLPAGTKRTLGYAWTATDWVTVVRPRSDVSYLNDGEIVGDVTVRGSPIVLIAPAFIVTVAAAVALLVGLATGLIVARRRRPAIAARHATSSRNKTGPRNKTGSRNGTGPRNAGPRSENAPRHAAAGRQGKAAR
ncbi:hypothetical protein [Actinoplanes sp. NBRC 103695]|uniref:hypothetical protein n=1 Tax=Actinoplanes sp. NBRC 103695 TaxID=3032202 RepID=UPI0024A5BC5C|nr:hypothetical protein [Actinoplanes sp. NBRC 103695]GLZ00201.1 hypothetical protein Acsp02_74530 [Actinoplanes sp. NBRC 103695]